jgi:hypothetical protein
MQFRGGLLRRWAAMMLTVMAWTVGTSSQAQQNG